MNRFTASRLGLPALRRKGGRGTVRPVVAASRFSDSTHAELAWGRARVGSMRWSVAGALAGALIALVCFAPAAWLANAVSNATQQKFMLADARGTIWSGSAVAVLTGGAGSHDASVLPGRLVWSMRPQGLGMLVRLSQPCCLNGDVAIALKPSLAGFTAVMQPQGATVGQWPAAWLSGLGTPWNTIQLGGVLRVLSSGMTLESSQGRWHLVGGMELELMGASSRLSTLHTLGSYRLSLRGAPADAAAESAGGVQFTLSTLGGTLQLSGAGAWSRGQLHFQGEARSSDADDAALTNLLNIIGRREGARSVISIG
jgi:general secretion pathway protein N